jgi:hypothetical protein
MASPSSSIFVICHSGFIPYSSLVIGHFQSPPLLRSGGRRSRRSILLPGPLRGFDHQTLLNSAGSHPHVTDFPVYNRFDPLEVGKESAFGDRSDVRSDTACFLGFAAAPYNAALHGPFACQFTNSGHRFILILVSFQQVTICAERGKGYLRGQNASRWSRAAPASQAGNPRKIK